MNIFLVLCHPRRDSLTGTVADAFTKGALEAGHRVDFFDLYREGFNPVLEENDEPSNGRLDSYSNDIQENFNRLNKNEAVVMVFPLWWWSTPAMLKGWIDRVWNYGLTYGPAAHNLKKGAMFILPAHTEDELKKRNYLDAITTSLNVGVFHYNKIYDSEVVFLGGTNRGRKHCTLHIETAYKKGLKF